MVHLRIVAPNTQCRHVLDLLENSDSVFNIVHLENVARKPEGDLVLCDVARRDVSLLVADLRELNVDVDGSIAIEEVDAEISALTSNTFRRRRDDVGADPVVWENVSSRTSENVELSQSYLIFMTAAMLIAAVGIYFNQPILIVGAMVVGPDFGPIAGVCVALVNRSRRLVRRSATALFVGFLVGTVATYVATVVLREVGQIPESIDFDSHTLVRFISNPDFFSVYVALARRGGRHAQPHHGQVERPRRRPDLGRDRPRGGEHRRRRRLHRLGARPGERPSSCSSTSPRSSSPASSRSCSSAGSTCAVASITSADDDARSAAGLPVGTSRRATSIPTRSRRRSRAGAEGRAAH